MPTDSPQVLALRQRYRSSLPEKAVVIAEFEQLLSSDESSSCSTLLNSSSETVGDYLHKLAGSAGMYEYDDIAGLARSAMAQCKQDDKRGLMASLNQLMDLLDQHS